MTEICSCPLLGKFLAYNTSVALPYMFFLPTGMSRLEKELLEVYMKPFFIGVSRDIWDLNKKNPPSAEIGRASHDLRNVLLSKSSVDPMFSFCSYSFAHACSLFKMWSHHSQGETAYSTSSCSRWQTMMVILRFTCSAQTLQIILNLDHYSAIKT